MSILVAAVADKQTFAERVAEALIEQLAAGTAPWQRPWSATAARLLPYNPTTGKDYRGGNALWLMATASHHSFVDNRWMTYRQADAAGGQVRKGEKGTPIQYWQWDTQDQNEKGEKIGEPARLARPRVFTAVVFNASQIDGLPPEAERAMIPEWQRHKTAEDLIIGSGAVIEHRAINTAYYNPGKDMIVVPERVQFDSPDRYYATVLHELGHWTGHEDRLNRDLKHPFGSEGYAREELRAEIASMLIGDRLGIGHDPGQHVAYVGSWIKALQADPREIFRAATAAEGIADYMQSLSLQQSLAIDEAEHGATERISTPALPEPQERIMPVDAERTYIAVAYEDRAEVKELGAKWDRTAKSWYVSSELDIAPFSRWLPERANSRTYDDVNPALEFKEALESAGLKIDGLPRMDGQTIRVQVDGDNGKERSGLYRGFLDGRPAGQITNFRTGYKSTWKASATSSALSAQERAKLAATAASLQAQRAIERETVQDSVADAVAKLWAAAVPATDDHPYLRRKDVPAYGVRVDTLGGMMTPPGAAIAEQQSFSHAGNLLVPMIDGSGALRSLQSISSTGMKGMPKGSQFSGLYHLIPGRGAKTATSPIILCEGYATGAELARETGAAVAVAFSANNLAEVAHLLREKEAKRPILVCGDNDHAKEGQVNIQGQPKQNVGKAKAIISAAEVGGAALLPPFRVGDKGSDWNDYRVLYGMDGFSKALQTAIISAHRQITEKEALAQRATEQQVEAKRDDIVQERPTPRLARGGR